MLIARQVRGLALRLADHLDKPRTITLRNGLPVLMYGACYLDGCDRRPKRPEPTQHGSNHRVSTALWSSTLDGCSSWLSYMPRRPGRQTAARISGAGWFAPGPAAGPSFGRWRVRAVRDVTKTKGANMTIEQPDPAEEVPEADELEQDDHEQEKGEDEPAD